MSYLTVSYAAAKFTSLNPILELGEIGTETDTGKFKEGDSVTAWNSLPYGFTPSPGSNIVSLSVPVDFGFEGPTWGEQGVAPPVTVPYPAITASSQILCAPELISTSGHDPEDALQEGVFAGATNIVPGAGFDISAGAIGDSWGQYSIAVQIIG